MIDHPAYQTVWQSIVTTPQSAELTPEQYVENVTDRVVDALLATGHLKPVGQPETVEHVAERLSDASKHPRLTGTPDGWTQLLHSPVMVEFAAFQAIRQGADKDQVKADQERLTAYFTDTST